MLGVVAVGAFLGGALTTDARVTNSPESERAYDLQAERFSAEAPTEIIVVRLSG